MHRTPTNPTRNTDSADVSDTAEIPSVTTPRMSPVRRLAAWVLPFATAAAGVYIGAAAKSGMSWATVMDLVRPLAIVGMALAAGCLAADRALDLITARIDRNRQAVITSHQDIVIGHARIVAMVEAQMERAAVLTRLQTELIREARWQRAIRSEVEPLLRAVEARAALPHPPAGLDPETIGAIRRIRERLSGDGG